MPKVSVVMPAYNAEKYIEDAIESILNQTFTDFEFIIINDGSSDKTKSIIQAFHDSRLVYLENSKNLGIVETLNKGLNYASGEYIARMDADDIAMPKRIEKQIKTMERNRTIGVLGTGTRVFGDGIETYDSHSSLNSDELKANLLFSTCLCHPSVMIRKNVLDRHYLKYDSQFKGAEDYKLWWDIVQVSKLSCLPEPLHCYRIHPNQISQVKDKIYKDLLFRMLNVRLDTLDVKLSDPEKDVFLLYCNGDFSTFTEEKLLIYVNALRKIITKNDYSHFFMQSKLKEVCSLSITRTLNNSGLSEEEKKRVYKVSVKYGVYPNSVRIRLWINRLIKQR